MSAPPLQDDALERGSVLDGRYRIDGVIGGGGMARVYRAEHLGIARQVAIKVLHADLRRSPEAVARFRREATTSGRLVHPNIVTVTDFGVLPDGRCFLVMEALEGETLADRLEREGTIPWPAAVTLLGELLRGLRHAHDHGVIHRDIKPENLFLVRGDPKALVKILDFGIAKLYEGIPGEARITQGGLTIGTPLYMSPEQTLDGEIAPASDLYSTTVVLFEMVTGEPPFYFDDPIATMKAHLRKPPPKLRDIAPELDVPGELEELVARGLAKGIDERIHSADAYLAMLDALRVAEGTEPRGVRPSTAPPAAEPVAATPAAMMRLQPGFCDAETQPGPAALAQAPRRPRRLAAAGALIFVGVTALVTYLALRTSARGPAAPPASSPPIASTLAPAPAAAPGRGASATELEPPPAGRTEGAAGEEKTIADRGSADRGSAAPPGGGAQPARARDRAQVKHWVTQGNLALAAGRLDEADAQLRRAIAAHAAAHAAHAGLAEVAYNKGDFQRAVQSGKRAVALAPRAAAYRMTLAKAYYKLLRHGDAIAQWQKALELDPSNASAKRNIELARSKLAQ